ncbi:MAG: metallophosphoesterase, partial [Bacteroidia bacterium]
MYLLLFIVLFFVSAFSFAQRPFEIIQTIYFIGDAGKYEITNNVLKRLKTEIENDELSTVVFLGDNVYPQGLDGKKKSENKLLAQLSILDNYKGNVFFIPGNHDWKMGKPGGYKTVLRQAAYVENYLNKTTVANKNNLNFLPVNALPGPYDTLITEGLRMV